MQKEYIICSAIWININEIFPHQPNNITNGLVVCGHRHHNCFIIISNLNDKIKGDINDSKLNNKNIQGFLTNTNRFVNRYEAFEIAIGADQVIINKERNIKKLFSEDIY